MSYYTTNAPTHHQHAYVQPTEQTGAHQAKQQLEVLFEMSRLLDTGLSRDQLSVCIQLIEAGMDPETMAALVKEIKREAAALQR